jgi:hypothetical protein
MHHDAGRKPHRKQEAKPNPQPAMQDNERFHLTRFTI